MSDPQIVCPKCGHEIKLTASLAAPLIEATRKRFKEQLDAKDADIATQKEEALHTQQVRLARDRESIEDQVAERLRAERSQIVAVEAKKARAAAATEFENKNKELTELQQVLAENNQKLATAQQAHAELIRKERALEDARRELDLTIEQRVQPRAFAVLRLMTSWNFVGWWMGRSAGSAPFRILPA